jgi:hypothetical protein
VAVDVHGADRGSSSTNRCRADLPGLEFQALGQVAVERWAADSDNEIGCDDGTKAIGRIRPAAGALVWPHSDPELSQEIPVLMLALCVLVPQLGHSVFVEPLNQQAVHASITDDSRHNRLRDLLDAFAAEQSLTAWHVGQQRLDRLKRQRKPAEPPLYPGLHFGRSLRTLWLVTAHERELTTSRNHIVAPDRFEPIQRAFIQTVPSPATPLRSRMSWFESTGPQQRA